MWKVKFTDFIGPLEIRLYPRPLVMEQTPNNSSVRRDVGQTLLSF